LLASVGGGRHDVEEPGHLVTGEFPNAGASREVAWQNGSTLAQPEGTVAFVHLVCDHSR
jgi:hypothetical protein